MPLDKKDFARLMNQARVKLPGASDAGLKGELFDVLNEFFNDTNTWTEELQLAILPNVTAYTLTPKHGGTIIRLGGVWTQDEDGNPAIPTPAHMPVFGELRLFSPSNTSQTYTVVVVKNVVLPTSRDDVPDAPDWVLRVYERVILDGLLGRMMGQMDKTYSSDSLSTYHLRRFRDGAAMARVAHARQNIMGAQTWRFPQTFRVR